MVRSWFRHHLFLKCYLYDILSSRIYLVLFLEILFCYIGLPFYPCANRNWSWFSKFYKMFQYRGRWVNFIPTSSDKNHSTGVHRHPQPQVIVLSHVLPVSCTVMNDSVTWQWSFVWVLFVSFHIEGSISPFKRYRLCNWLEPNVSMIHHSKGHRKKNTAISA